MKRTFCGIGGGFLLGAWIASFLRTEAGFVLGVCSLVAGAVVLLFYRGKIKPALSVFLLFMGAGFLLFAAKTQFVYQPVAALSGERMMISGTVVDYKKRDNGKYAYEIETNSTAALDGFEQETQEKFRFLLYTDTALEVDYYDKVTLPVEIFEQRESGLFDSRRYYSSQGIYLSAYAQGEEAAKFVPGKKPFRYQIRSLNRFLQKKLDENLSSHSAALLKEMILGDRSDIEEDVKEDYQLTGTIHLLSISGTHITLLAGFLELLLRRMRRFPRLKIFIEIFGILLFLFLSGLHLSAVRSGIMVLLLLGGRLFGRRADSLNSLFAAGFFIVLFDVYAIMDIGFLMSFLATLGILTLAPRCAELGKRTVESWLGQRAVELLAVSLSANLFLMPVYILQFGSLSIISPIVNLPVSMTAALILGLGFPLTALGFLPIPRIFYLVEEVLIFIQEKIISFFAGMKYASVGVNFDSIKLWLFFTVCLLAIGFLWRKKGTLKVAAAFSAILLILSSGIAMWESLSSIQIHIIGDGSTANVLFLYGSHASVISVDDNDYIDRATLNYLRSKNITEVDNLILTYENFNEYRDTFALLDGIPVQNVFYPEQAEAIPMILKEEQDCNLLKITPELTQIAVNGELYFRTGYYKKGLFLEIDCYGRTIFLGTAAACAEREHKDLFLVRGRLRKPPELPKGGTAVLLQSPYEKEAGAGFLSGYDSCLEYHVYPGRGLRPKKKIFSW